MLRLEWQYDPLSGAGAALFGGRWNIIGSEALYLSRSHSTAIAEFNQAFIRPGTLVAYDVASNAIADLTNADWQREIAKADLTALFASNWRDRTWLNGDQPMSWQLVQTLQSAGAHGALVPSVQQRDGVNLVLWNWSADGSSGAAVRVIDPEGELWH